MEYIAIFLFSFLLIDLVLSCIAYKVAGDKGRNQLGWFFFGVVFKFYRLAVSTNSPGQSREIGSQTLISTNTQPLPLLQRDCKNECNSVSTLHRRSTRTRTTARTEQYRASSRPNKKTVHTLDTPDRQLNL